MAEPTDKKKRLEEIGALIGEAIIVAAGGPESGQGELSNEDREKIKGKVSEAFSQFMEHREWQAKTDPVLEQFKKAMMPKLIRQKLQEKVAFDEAIKEAFPTLDAEFEGHAVLNLIANMAIVGPFRKIKEETLAKVIENEYSMAGLIIQYLHWRVQSTTPPKEEQH